MTSRKTAAITEARKWLDDIGRATLHGSPPFKTFAAALTHLGAVFMGYDDLLGVVKKSIGRTPHSCRLRPEPSSEEGPGWCTACELTKTVEDSHVPPVDPT